MATTITPKQLMTLRKSLDAEWELNTKKTTLIRKYTFHNYIEGLIFVTRVSVHAEVLHHHPEILLKYGMVQVTLTTHETKSLTKLDFELAKHCDTIYSLSTAKLLRTQRTH